MKRSGFASHWRFGFLSILASCVAVGAQPAITVEQRSVIHPMVVEGTTDTIVFAFWVSNPGNAPLRIGAVETSCGCTSVQYDSVVAAGDTARVVVNVDIKGRSAPFYAHIAIVSNAHNAERADVELFADIEPCIDVCGGWQAGDSVLMLELRTRYKELRVQSVRVDADSGAAMRTVRLRRKTDYRVAREAEAGQTGFWLYFVRINRAAVPGGRLRSVHIATNHGCRSTVTWRTE